MRQRPLLSLFFLSVLVPCAKPQTANSTQHAPDEKTLLARAQQGDASSQMWLGAGYEQGWFGQTNYSEALKWFRRAAEQGDPDAQVSLGQMYEDGEGVTQSYSLAAKWYRKAAEHDVDLGGAGQGRNDLGILYLYGRGVPQDYVQAYMWFRLADFRTSSNLPLTKAQMTPLQILEAEQLAAEWKSRRIKPQ